MKPEIFNYDIYPKVFPCSTDIKITVKPLGEHAAFKNNLYSVKICPLSEGFPLDYPNRPNNISYTAAPDSEGNIVFIHNFASEQEYFIRLYKEGENNHFLQLSVFAVASDLCGRYPLIGDFHMHTFRSDGKESPAIVAANYRKHGYDFLVITDHQRYYPSLEAIAAFRDVKTEYTIIPGEEVHLPKMPPDRINDVHIVNAGGSYSVNALVDNTQISEVGSSKELRSSDGQCPAPITFDEYAAEVEALIPELNIPDEIEAFTYASCVWIFNHIKKGNGLGIFAHPYWISNVYQVPESFTDFMMERRPFDAYEVLGGESYFAQNGNQTARFYEDRAKGRITPIVGSTDSHGSIDNANKYVASTIVFSPENTRESIISSIKEYYSVAVDGISAETRYVGDFRFIKYANFLMENYFPLHDDLCYEEGRLMKDYVCGSKDAAEHLALIYGRVGSLRRKYFAF